MEYILKNKKEDDITCQLADGHALYNMHMYTLRHTQYTVQLELQSSGFWQLTPTRHTILQILLYSTKS